MSDPEGLHAGIWITRTSFVGLCLLRMRGKSGRQLGGCRGKATREEETAAAAAAAAAALNGDIPIHVMTL